MHVIENISGERRKDPEFRERKNACNREYQRERRKDPEFRERQRERRKDHMNIGNASGNISENTMPEKSVKKSQQLENSSRCFDCDIFCLPYFRKFCIIV